MIPLPQKLLHAIAVKAILEILLIALAATLATRANFHPGIRGAIDIADPTRVAGWASDPADPAEPLEVHLYVDGRFHAATLASRIRPDLVRAGATTNPARGFEFSLSPTSFPPGRHLIEVFARRPALDRHQTLIPLSEHSLTIVTPAVF